MAPKKHQPESGPQQRYKWGGFGSVWRWAKGHSIHRWIKARNWAKRRAHQAKDPKGFKKAQAAYAKKIKWFHAHEPPKHDPGSGSGLLSTFDGRQAPTWIVKAMEGARASGYWGGSCISGFRSPAYSISLCEAICGAPACPGTCAGAASNHACPPSGTGKPYEGAVDCTDAARLCAWARAHGIPLHGGGEFLPNDVNHCSYSGR